MTRKCLPLTHTVVAIAGRQRGVVARRQLLALGASSDWITLRADAGWLIPIHHGVYAVGHRRLSHRGWFTAAVLAGGEGAVLSHRSAAALLDLRTDERLAIDSLDAAAPVDITVSAVRKPRPGLVVHRARALDPRDTTVAYGIPTTSVMRTLVDLAAAGLAERDLERAVECAARQHTIDLPALERHRGRTGIARLVTILGGSVQLTRAESEAQAVRLIRSGGLPEPLVNSVVHGIEVDLWWPAQRLIVEVDGHAFHGTRPSIREDHRRDRRLRDRGERVERITALELFAAPQSAVGFFAGLLAAG